MNDKKIKSVVVRLYAEYRII